MTGNDATIAALQLIISGDQYNTISKPSEIVAAAAANIAVKLINGKTFKRFEPYPPGSPFNVSTFAFSFAFYSSAIRRFWVRRFWVRLFAIHKGRTCFAFFYINSNDLVTRNIASSAPLFSN